MLPCIRFPGVQMIHKSLSIFAAAIFMANFLPTAAGAAGPEDQLVGMVKIALGKSFNTDWNGLETLAGIKWAPLPPAVASRRPMCFRCATHPTAWLRGRSWSCFDAC